MKLKVDVVQELGSEAKRQEDLVSEVKGLLASADADDEATISVLGIDVNRRIRDAALSETAQRRHASVLPNGSAINRGDLMRVGMKYNLKVRPVNEYIGVIPPELGASINRFVKEAAIPSVAHAKNRFFIMAPPSMFLAKSEDEVEREFPVASKRQVDPVLLYSQDNVNFDIVHRWGDDFTAWRSVLGYIKRGPVQGWILVVTCVALIIWSLVAAPLFPVFCENDEVHPDGHFAWYELLARGALVILGIVLSAIAIVRGFSDSGADVTASDVSGYSEAVFVPRTREASVLSGFAVRWWIQQRERTQQILGFGF